MPGRAGIRLGSRLCRPHSPVRLRLTEQLELNISRLRLAPHNVQISPGSPAYYLTSVTKDRLPVFRTDKIKTIVSNALDEARKSGGFLIFAYVIMPDHLHLVTDSSKKPEEILRYVNGIVAPSN